MNISVTKDNVIIIEDSDLPHENEYKITKCYFTFDEFTEPFQVKRAIFTILSTGEMYETDIINNELIKNKDFQKILEDFKRKHQHINSEKIICAFRTYYNSLKF